MYGPQGSENGANTHVFVVMLKQTCVYYIITMKHHHILTTKSHLYNKRAAQGVSVNEISNFEFRLPILQGVGLSVNEIH